MPIKPMRPRSMPRRCRLAATAVTICRMGRRTASESSSYQRWAELQGMTMARAPACFSRLAPCISQGSGSSPPFTMASVRSGMRGSLHKIVGMCC